jgi:glutathione peroxidase
VTIPDSTTDVLDVPLARLDGTPGTARGIAGDRVVLLVNVASRCGLTPQYAGLERLQETYGDAGLTVVGVPCNQFGGQEPGTSDEIATFCSATYGVTFPLSEKIEVNGAERHPLYTRLVGVPDEQGRSGDIRWNFEKFVVDRAGHVVARFSPGVEPDDARLIAVLETSLRS